MPTTQELQTLVNTLTSTNTQQSQQIAELTEANAKLSTQNAELTETNALQAEQIAELSNKYKKMEATLAWYQRQMFGKKSEKKLALANMPSLFPDEELDALEIVPEEEVPAEDNSVEDNPVEGASGAQHKNRIPAKRPRQNWDHLPVLETQVIEPEGIDPTRYRKIGEEITTQVCYQPGMLYRKLIVRPKYGLIDPTEPVERGEGVIIAPLPLLPIYKCAADASLLAEVLLKKYEYHMPFYRQIKEFAHKGMPDLKEVTLTSWFKRTMELLRPLYKALEVEVFKSTYVQADETVLPVINHEKGQADKEYLWVARAVQERLVFFFYEDGSRSGKVIKYRTDTHNFKGFIQCDGFDGYTSAYKSEDDVRLVHCLVHIRRYWDKALDENREAATWFLVKIRQLYHIEHECDAADMDYEQRKAVRLEKSKPIMEEMKKWMETEGVRYSESSLIGSAVTYTYVRWDDMGHVLEDGRLLLDNNLAENEIRPITLGRKNFLFCGNHEAANNMCVIASLLATCRNHNVNPRTYLTSVIAKMPYYERASHEELVKLLPHKWIEEHPEARMPDIRLLAKGKTNS